jgi:hypothetical protein
MKIGFVFSDVGQQENKKNQKNQNGVSAAAVLAVVVDLGCRRRQPFRRPSTGRPLMK